MPQFARRLASIAVFLLLAAPAFAKEWTKVRIGTEGSYPPFNYFDSDQILQGFDIDLARAVCAKMNLTCEFVAQDWEGLIPALLAGRYDAIFASMAITEERRKTVDFTQKYYQTPSMFVTLKSNAGMSVTPEALAGKRIGTQGGTVGEHYLKALYRPAGVEIRPYATQDEANLDLASGRIDAVLADKVVMMSWLEKTDDGACCRSVGPDLDDPKYFGLGAGAAVRKGDQDLKALLDKGLEAIIANGEYARINAKYFPFSIY